MQSPGGLTASGQPPRRLGARRTEGRDDFIEDAIWDRVVGVIDQNWAHIEAFFGSRVLRTIEPECHHVPAADTYHRMVEIRARDPS